MADLKQACVRERAMPFTGRTSRAEFFREVSAPLVQKKTLSKSSVTIERIERQGAGRVDWRYRQDRDALFYFEGGIVGCRGALDGVEISRQLNGASRLAYIEAGSTIETEVKVPGRCIYWVAFIDRETLLGWDKGLARPLVSRVGFESSAMAWAMTSLRFELGQNDELSALYLESWAMQALVLLHRSLTEPRPSTKNRLGGNEISKVMEFMEANVGNDITLGHIAKLVDLSPRHLRRLFLAATGVGPNQMFTNIRLDRAARDLRCSRKNITDISMDCGFSQPQHLATAFRRKFGLTPSEYCRNATS
jgi:AraC-like DNA-binding protein